MSGTLDSAGSAGAPGAPTVVSSGGTATDSTRRGLVGAVIGAAAAAGAVPAAVRAAAARPVIAPPPLPPKPDPAELRLESIESRLGALEGPQAPGNRDRQHDNMVRLLKKQFPNEIL
jgi:hypothetical protein